MGGGALPSLHPAYRDLGVSLRSFKSQFTPGDREESVLELKWSGFCKSQTLGKSTHSRLKTIKIKVCLLSYFFGTANTAKEAFVLRDPFSSRGYEPQ